MENTENPDDLLILMEAHAPVADSQSELRRIDSLQSFHIAGAGFSESFHATLNTPRGRLVERRHVVQSRFRPFNRWRGLF